jgi:hypothetical protein
MVATAITAATRREQAYHLLTTLGETSVRRPQLRHFKQGSHLCGRESRAGRRIAPPGPDSGEI